MAACMTGAVVSLRFAWVEHLLASNSRESVQRALRVAPANARAYERWVAFEPDQAVPLLRRAVALSPYLTAAWLELGLRAELAGDRKEAEALLLEAFRHDRMFLTRWTLANFYFRCGDESSFWRWARAAAEYACCDLASLFDLCHRMSPDPLVVLDKAIPPRPSVLHDYLGYLLTTGRLDGAPEAFTRLVAFRRPEDMALLLSVVERYIGSGKTTRAVAFWNQLAAAGLISYSPLDPAKGRSLTNGSFAAKALGLGFDWHRIWNPEAFISGNRIEFSGRQLDKTEVLWQPLPLGPGAAYTLQYRYRTSHIGANTGLRWHLLDPRTRQPLTAPSSCLSSDFETEQAWHFRVPNSVDLGHLTLLYTREPGTTRIAGSVEMLSLRLSLETAPREPASESAIDATPARVKKSEPTH